MGPRTRAMVYNFLGFAVLFLVLRFAFGYFFDVSRFYLALAAAVSASFLAPKFGVVKEEGRTRIMMEWIFIKGFREV
ncbi:MAG: hypothetical protein CR994_00695 [Maribacter sp.]|nr:MAG: hypothetical protein CR994_00695 [Maribacter sp.]